MASYQKLLFELDRGVARITLNRPEKRNALDPELISEVHDALETTARDESIRVVLLQGAGADFCSGMDLSTLEQSMQADVLANRAGAQALAALFLSMRRHPRPIIAAVHGRALAGGCGLATAADIILAAHSAQFGYTEVNIGFVPAIVMAMLRRSLPEKRAFELITAGEIISAQVALDIELVNHVFADQTFSSDVDAFITKLASKSASAVMLSKQLLYHIDALGFEAGIEAGVEINTIARSTDDCKRGVGRFLKKTR